MSLVLTIEIYEIQEGRETSLNRRASLDTVICDLTIMYPNVIEASPDICNLITTHN